MTVGRHTTTVGGTSTLDGTSGTVLLALTLTTLGRRSEHTSRQSSVVAVGSWVEAGVAGESGVHAIGNWKDSNTVQTGLVLWLTGRVVVVGQDATTFGGSTRAT